MSRVDVAVPCFQHGHFLRECIRSVLSQDIRDVRVLIIDNASTDNSVEVARQLAAEDKRVELIARRTNLGPHASFNEGIDWANGDFFTVLCADDLLTPGALGRALFVMEQHPDVAFAYGTYFVRRPGVFPAESENALEKSVWRLWGGGEFIERFCSQPVLTVSPLVRTTMQKRAGYYRSNLLFTDDLEMLARLALLGRVAETSAKQAVQLLHGSNISRSSSHFEAEEDMFNSFFFNEGAAIANADRLRQTAMGNIAKHAYWSAVSHLCRGHVSKSIRLFKYCLGRRPSMALMPPVDWLLRTEKSLSRSGDVLAESLRTLRTGARRLCRI